MRKVTIQSKEKIDKIVDLQEDRKLIETRISTTLALEFAHQKQTINEFKPKSRAKKGNLRQGSKINVSSISNRESPKRGVRQSDNDLDILIIKKKTATNNEDLD